MGWFDGQNIGVHQGHQGSCNLSIRFVTKARACKVVGQERKLDSHISCSQECKRVWGNDPSCSQVNSHFESQSLKWTLEFLESNYRGQNSMNWGIPYIIGKILKRRCLKWVRMTHLNICNTSYGRKKGWESNWQFDSQPLKVKNCPNFLACRWRATYHWKALNKGYNFDLDFITIRSFHEKLWAPKVARVPFVKIPRIPLGSLRQKNHLDVSLIERHKVYYKGDGGGFPQVWAVVSLVSPSLPVVRLNTKSAQTMR